MKNVEFVRFKQASAGDMRSLSVKQFALRWSAFRDLYERDEKLRLALAKIGVARF